MRYFLISIMLLMIGVGHGYANCSHHETRVGADFTLNSKFSSGTNSNLKTDIYELAFWYRGDDATIYSIIEDGQIELKEASIDFNFVGMGWKAGKVVVPFGFDYLERGTNSVFITAPRTTFYEFGLNLMVGDDMLRAGGTMNEDNEYALRLEVEPYKDGLLFVASYADHEKINEEFGEWSLAAKFFYSSLLLNLSVVTEYLPDIGGYWIRSVTSPGIFDFVGLMGGYYSLGNIGHGVDTYTYKPAWTYGFYMDVSKVTTLSTEWKIGEKFPSPYNIKLATTLNF